MKKIILQIMFMSAVSMMAFAGDYEPLDRDGKREVVERLIEKFSAPDLFFNNDAFMSAPSDTIQSMINMEIEGECSRRRKRNGLKPYSPENIAEIKEIVGRHFNLGVEDGGAAEDVAVMQEIPAPPALPAPTAEMLARHGARAVEQPRAERAQAPLAPPVARNDGGNGRGFNAEDLENAARGLRPVRARNAEAGVGGGEGAAVQARPQAQGRMAFDNLDLNQARQELRPVPKRAVAAVQADYMQEAMNARRQDMGFERDDDLSDDDWSDDDSE